MSAQYNIIVSFSLRSPFLSTQPGARALGIDASNWIVKHPTDETTVNIRLPGSMVRGNIRHALYYFHDVLSRSSEHSNLTLAQLNQWFGRASGMARDSDDFTIPMSSSQAAECMTTEVPTTTVDLVTGEERDTTLTISYETKDVVHYLIKEEWFYDKQRSVMDVRIIGLAPVVEVLDQNTGDFKGYKTLFWVYYPEARVRLSTKSICENDKRSISRYGPVKEERRCIFGSKRVWL